MLPEQPAARGGGSTKLAKTSCVFALPGFAPASAWNGRSSRGRSRVHKKGRVDGRASS